MSVHRRACIAAFLLVFLACSETSNRELDETLVCEPSASDFETIKPVLDNHCGQCHGEPPTFGAPCRLRYDASLMASAGEVRQSDRLIETIETG